MSTILRLALATILISLCATALAQDPPPNGVQATSTPLAAPAGLVYDAAGNLYIASLNDNVIRKVDLKGIITTVAGTGEQGFFGDGGAATAADLDNPAGIAIDTAGNLYIADTHNNRIRKVSAATGIITTIAGTGAPGFSGDSGAATSATLDLPTALALDASGNLYIADTNNNRIRKITGTTITTVAGDGEQVFAGDGGAATAAGLDSPAGIALDAAGNIYIADTHDQRIRVVTAATGIITTFAGAGIKSFGGDSGAATAASLARPRGLAFDASGKLYIADSDNNRIRAISGSTITTLAGTGEQSFSGDAGLATDAALDTPRSTAASAQGNIAFTDTANQRARAVSTDGLIETVAGVGSVLTPTLVLSGATTVIYGSAGTLTATYTNQSATGTGTVTLLEGTTSRGSGSLSGNTVTFNLPVLSMGTHYLAASYAGDSSNPPAASGVFTLVVTGASVTAAANPISVTYGLPIPALSGTLTGVLPADSANVAAVYSSAATQGSNVGVYPITATLSGSAATNYTLTSTTGSLTITAAPTTTALIADTNPAYLGVPVHLTATVSASTSGTIGTPNGTVNFFVNGTLSGNSPLTNGVATYTTAPAIGTQPIYAVYVPSTTPVQNWSASTSNTISESVTADPDFSINSPTAPQSVVPGQSVSYTINVVPNPTPFTGTVAFSVTGLPVGATATFSPDTVTPGSNPSATTLTIKAAPVVSMLRVGSGIGGSLAFTLLLLPLADSKRRKAARKFTRLTSTFLLCFAAAMATATLSGCGSTGFFGQGQHTYTVTVTGTSTNAAGAPLVRSTTVSLTVQ